jgi:hypothetical protein
VQPALTADLAAHVVVRVEVTDDLTAAVIEDQQRPVSFCRPVMPGRDWAVRPGDRQIGHLRHGEVLFEAGRQDAQLFPRHGDVIVRQQAALDTDRALCCKHQLERGVERVAVDGDRTEPQQHAFDPVGDVRKGPQRDADGGVDDRFLASALDRRLRVCPGRLRSVRWRLAWQTLSHGSSLDHAQ